METTISLNGLLQQILGLPLRDQEWLVGKVQENIREQEEQMETITEEELLAKIDTGLKDLKAGRTRPLDEVLNELEHAI